jgi:hypothetical protein
VWRFICDVIRLGNDLLFFGVDLLPCFIPFS